jgi:hypothetical protein
MSYDIYFYRLQRDEVTAENIDYFLESSKFGKDEHVISTELMYEIKDALFEKGLKFEVFENKYGIVLGLAFGSFVVHMFPGEIAISIPFQKENSDESVVNEIDVISETIVGKGLLGYDPQTSAFITDKEKFQSKFTEMREAIDHHISQVFPRTEESPKSFWERLLEKIRFSIKSNIRWWAIQFLIFIVGLILIIVFKSFF